MVKHRKTNSFYNNVHINQNNYIILEPTKVATINEFIQFWSIQYFYSKNEAFYDENIYKPTFVDEDIYQLYTWKNGMKLSSLKKNSIQTKIISKLNLINTFKKDKAFDVAEFLNEFKAVSFVWKIFLLHIIKPNKYPIYDQHIHRAIGYFHFNNDAIVNAKPSNFYFQFYLNFIKEHDIKDLREMDKAFFAFGQFLKTKGYRNLLSQH